MIGINLQLNGESVVMRLEISCEDRKGITQDVLDVLNNYDIDLRGIQIDALGKLFLDFPTIDFADFQMLMPKLRKIKGIVDVRTTAFMPIQHEHNLLRALLESVPDPVFSVDANGNIILHNEVVSIALKMSPEKIRKTNINDLIQGFNFTKWLQGKCVSAQAQKVQFIKQDYIAEILPVDIPDQEKNILAGAVIMLKSEDRLGEQINAFRQASTGKFENFIANSTSMRRLIREAKRISELDGNILITGDSGTGKELIAKACHDSSRWSDGEFVTLDCASLPDHAVETELFGHTLSDVEHGEGNGGLFEQAAGGTLVLDQVSEMSSTLQAKLLRVLEYGTFHQIGDSRVKYIDCRIICISSKDLSQCVQEGHFRLALYYRLNVLGLYVPSLRDRKSDIVPLANEILSEHAKNLAIKMPKLSQPCVEYLQSIPWAGNVRQLKNVLYRAITLLEGNVINLETLQQPSCSATVTYIDENFDGTLEQEVKRFERDMLNRLYPAYPSTRLLARKLGLSHTAIANKLREYGISKHSAKLQ